MEEGRGPQLLCSKAGQCSRPSDRVMWELLVSPAHAEWPSWAHSHPEEIAGEWALCAALSEEERNKMAQVYSPKKHTRSVIFDKTAPVAFLPESARSGGALESLRPPVSPAHPVPLSPRREDALANSLPAESAQVSLLSGWQRLCCPERCPSHRQGGKTKLTMTFRNEGHGMGGQGRNTRKA